MKPIGRMTRIARATLASALAFGVFGCNFAADHAAAAHGIDVFHQEFDSGNFPQIWNGSGSEMHASTNQAVFLKFLTTVHDKLGNVTKSASTATNISYNNGVTFATIRMHTQFEHGVGDETFVFKTNGSATQLVGYHVNSDDLMRLL